MPKSDNTSIHTIDKSIREQMHLLDHFGDNYFSDTITLITNFEPYAKKVVLGRPTRTPEHRIILVRRGSTSINVSYDNHDLTEGHLILIPANSVLIKKAQSDDYNVFCLAFRIPEVEHLGLIDYKETHIKLSDTDRRMVENYFRLLEQLLKAKSINHQSISHLIISLLYSVHGIEQEMSIQISPLHPDRSQEIMNKFIRLLLEQDYPVRKMDYYAEKLNISKGHLADVIKEKSNKTTMDWINDRTILLAQAMLASTDEIIELIGEKLFLPDPSQFIKFFKKHTGETPNEYRRRMK